MHANRFLRREAALQKILHSLVRTRRTQHRRRLPRFNSVLRNLKEGVHPTQVAVVAVRNRVRVTTLTGVDSRAYDILVVRASTVKARDGGSMFGMLCQEIL